MMKLKVLLVKPFGIADEIMPPISLGWLASQIRNDYDVKILDALKEKANADDIAKIVASERINVVGFQAWSKDIHTIKNACLKIKDANPEVITIVGGIHPTMVPEGTIKFFGRCLDFAYKGEGEIGFKILLDILSSHNMSSDSLAEVPGLVWRNGSAIMVNTNSFIEALDPLGFPAWDLMPPTSYPQAPHGAFYKNFPVALCTHSCNPGMSLPLYILCRSCRLRKEENGRRKWGQPLMLDNQASYL